MQRQWIGLITLAAMFSFATACADEQAPVDRVGVNVVDKSLFTGSWYYSRTVIDVDYEAAGAGTYPGDAAIDFGAGGLTSLPRIRWVIDEDTLFAFRDYELLEGADPSNPEPGEHLGHPVAAFSIETHFDIRRSYNSATGEEQNVLVENSMDRLWYERDYMRVDWSQNLLPGYYGQIANLYEVLGLYNREPAGLFVQAQSDFPDSWQPQFDFMACGGVDDESCEAYENDLAEDYEQGELYHFSFVTQELLSPGIVPDPFTGRPVNYCLSPYSGIPLCSTVAIFVRNSFLRVSDTRQYVAQNWLDTRFERHGYFRVERTTVDRMSSAADPAMGVTDFRNLNINRHNIWREWFNEETDEAIPFSERRVRPIVYYATSELPAHLVQPSMAIVAEWGTVFMNLVRSLRGEALVEYPEVACQSEDVDAYCYCQPHPDTDEIINPTCQGRYDPFQTPADAAAAGVINPYDCYVTVPEGAEPDLAGTPGIGDEDFYGWYGSSFAGSECVAMLRNNTCNRASIPAAAAAGEVLDCQERGDMRFKYISYVDQPGTGFLGVATLRGDPVTGELIVGDANHGGPALDGYRTSALQAFDLMNGTLDDRTFIIGEDVRGYLENLNQVQLPAPPRTDFLEAMRHDVAAPREIAGVDNRMAAFAARADRLAGPDGRANTYIGRRQQLRGTEIERRLMENMETFAMAGIERLPDGRSPADINDAILDDVSPFRISVHDQLSQRLERENAYSMANMMLPNEYVDNSVMNFVSRHQNWHRSRLEFGVNRLLYYETQLHELGHCLGLRHDFGASADTNNYFNEYYEIDRRFPLPDPRDFDGDGTNGLSSDEQVAYEDAFLAAKEIRELAGIDQWQNASVMEYTAQWYERTVTRTGHYDDAAVSFGYADLVEVYENTAGDALADLNPADTPRRWLKYYHGGESCNVDNDCGFAAGGANSAELTATNTASGLTQRCVAHPSGAGSHGNICSNFDDDAAAMTMASPNPAFAAVQYRFCSDDRVGTLGYCHRFDEGASYREIVQNISEQYNRQYIFTNFRRYRRSFSIGGYLFNRLIGRQFNILQDIFQSMLWQYQSDPEYRSTEGAFGFYDQFMSTADIMNFYARIMAQPDVGSYQWDEGWERYRRVNVDPNLPGAELRMPIGPGRYFGSIYQRGLTGITRLERIGSFYDKWFTMQMLTQRGWTQAYTRDVPYWTNYYDLFPVEMQQIFQGMIQDLPESIAPRLECASGAFPVCDEPRLVYMDLYRGDCSDASTCRPDPVDVTYADMPVVDGGGAATLQFLAVIFALTDFPTFFDSSFQNQLYICVEGNGACFEPDADAVEGEDYIRYFSERYGKSFIAWQVEPSEFVVNQESIGFSMVQEAGQADCLIDALRVYRGDEGGDPYSAVNNDAADLACIADAEYTISASRARVDLEIERLDGRLRDLESFFFQVIQLENEIGIASYLRF